MTPGLPCRSLGVAARAIADAAIGRFNPAGYRNRHAGYRNRTTQQVILLCGNFPMHRIDEAMGITHPSFALNHRQ